MRLGCTGATPFLSSSQHDAQECPVRQRCLQEFSTQESGAVLQFCLRTPLIHHSFRPVLLVVNESWYSIDVSLQLAILRSYPPQRCDAARPHCATCVKYVITGSIANAPDLTLCQTMACSNQRTSSTRIRVSPFSVFCHIDLTAIFSCSHPTEPQCSYDPVEGLPLAPDADPLEKIKELEEQVGAFLYCCLSLTVLIFLCSCTHEETEITEGKRIPLSVSISQPSSTSF